MHKHAKITILSEKFNSVLASLVHGILTLINKDIDLIDTKIYPEKNIEAIFVGLKFANNILNLVNIYNKPCGRVETILCILDCILSEKRTNAQVVVTGDFNIDMLKETPSKKKLQSFMQMKGLRLKTTKPTTSAGSMLDHFWTNLHDDVLAFNVSDAYWTDHYMTFLSISAKYS